MLVQNLGLEVIAEGIETMEQLQQLQHVGCKFGQGYLFSRPVDASTAESLLGRKLIDFNSYSPLPFQMELVESSEIH